MKFEISANMHLYLEVDEQMEENAIQDRFYELLEKLSKEIKGLSYTIHEVEQNEI